MSDEEFVTSHDTLKLADEVACLKMMVTLILKGMGQADAGKVIINMERYVQTLGDKPQAEVFSNTIKQIKTAYRQ
ncbi:MULTISPECIES: DUF2594 family protein [Pantoea]|jgi:hypothetical protein|uniref:DUF2594 family protein n=2 Tax=Pantoea TaxID=53335 RepID=A0AAJ5QIB1_9GAMM|nr:MULTISPECIES: DUF2594 family protein [Pantoea]MDT0175627.1 DUF2594 family protein [Enterobacter sp. BRE11]POW57579.1 DUF2594 domain-containing protein [Pantoea alvi]MBS6436905.1 DUF2594 family protein [Pantoea sp.]MBZ6385361.1 DUF2594 family protein [Pantoea piersonii]MBZ6401704.1 DUF2594 family protein [Pantoea piersonii]